MAVAGELRRTLHLPGTQLEIAVRRLGRWRGHLLYLEPHCRVVKFPIAQRLLVFALDLILPMGFGALVRRRRDGFRRLVRGDPWLRALIDEARDLCQDWQKGRETIINELVG